MKGPKVPRVTVAAYHRGIRQPGEWGVYLDGWIVGGPLSDKSDALHSAEVVRAALEVARKAHRAGKGRGSR